MGSFWGVSWGGILPRVLFGQGCVAHNVCPKQVRNVYIGVAEIARVNALCSLLSAER